MLKLSLPIPQSHCTVYNVNMLFLNLLHLTGIKLSINDTLFCFKQYMDTKLALPQTSNRIFDILKYPNI